MRSKIHVKNIKNLPCADQSERERQRERETERERREEAVPCLSEGRCGGGSRRRRWGVSKSASKLLPAPYSAKGNVLF